MRKTLYTLLILVAGCQTQPDAPKTEQRNQPAGTWEMHMDLGADTLNTFVTIDDSLHFTFHNADEAITTTAALRRGDSLYVEMPVFRSYFVLLQESATTIKGTWYNPGKSAEYHIPVSFQRIDALPAVNYGSDTLTYAITFSEGTEDAYPAIGQFLVGNGTMKGTFLTETGDYRYLHGEKHDDRFSLRCFDGSHAFLFTGSLTDSLVNGTFYSGNHWSEPFSGRKDSDVMLRNPYSLTFTTSQNPISFNAVDASGEIQTFDSEEFKNHVTIVQIFGTWCPNCLDESRFYKELFTTYADRGLRIIPVAFERGQTFEANVQHINEYKQDLGLPYDSFIGGTASKAEAGKLFPMLNEISSFPTSLFIDQNGVVRKIHTGFYGPGTGKHYERYVNETKALIEQMLYELTL